MFKTQVEPPGTGEWFHCKVLNTVRFKLLFTITIITEVSPPENRAREKDKDRNKLQIATWVICIVCTLIYRSSPSNRSGIVKLEFACVS